MKWRSAEIECDIRACRIRNEGRRLTIYLVIQYDSKQIDANIIASTLSTENVQSQNDAYLEWCESEVNKTEETHKIVCMCSEKLCVCVCCFFLSF